MTTPYFFSSMANGEVLDGTDEMFNSYVIIVKKTDPATTKQTWFLDADNAIRTANNLYPVLSEGKNHSNTENGAVNLI